MQNQSKQARRIIFQGATPTQLKHGPTRHSQTMILNKNQLSSTQSNPACLMQMQTKNTKAAHPMNQQQMKMTAPLSPYMNPSNGKSATLNAMAKSTGQISISTNSHTSSRKDLLASFNNKPKSKKSNKRSNSSKFGPTQIGKQSSCSGRESTSEYQLQGKQPSEGVRDSTSPEVVYDQMGSGLHSTINIRLASSERSKSTISEQSKSDRQSNLSPNSGQTENKHREMRLYKVITAQQRKIRNLQMQLKAGKLLKSIKAEVEESETQQDEQKTPANPNLSALA